MPKPSSSKDLKKLQKQWYSKLKKEGFKDIERTEFYEERPNFLRHSNIKRRGIYAIKEEYYRLARSFLHDHMFLTAADKIIWEQHSEGVAMRTISVNLRKIRVRRATTQVKETIHKLRKLMIELYR